MIFFEWVFEVGMVVAIVVVVVVVGWWHGRFAGM